jgi:hypothetical protein
LQARQNGLFPCFAADMFACLLASLSMQFS